MEDRALTPEVKELIEAYKAGRVLPDLQIAEASYTVLEGYRWLPYPTPPPVVAEYYKYPKDQKKKMNDNPEMYRKFFDDPVVRGYFNTKEKIETQNMRNKEWLKWMKSTLMDEGQIAGVDLMLHKFSDTYIAYIEQPAWTE